MKRIALLGSTGSIGVSCLEVVADFPDHFEIVALTGANNLQLLAAQIRRFRPQIAAVLNEADALTLRALVSSSNSSRSWDLRCLVRERLICYARENHPHILPRTRVLLARPGETPAEASTP